MSSTVVTRKFTENATPGVGVVSFASWNNPAVMSGLRQMFNCKVNERIVAIEIDKDGIKVTFG